VTPPGDWTEFVEPSRAYRTLVSKVDADGNEVAGIRLPDIAAPLATYTGWNEYKAPYPTGELADRDGSYLAFAATKSARASTGDPRLSIAERYPDQPAYVSAVKVVVDSLMKDRLLLPDDAEAYLVRAAKNIHQP
jgi:hypothetical protein